MNTRNIVVIAVIVILVIVAVMLINRNNSHSNDLSRSFDKAADNIEEGANDAKRNIKDALD